jgi:hypothetical protein
MLRILKPVKPEGRFESQSGSRAGAISAHPDTHRQARPFSGHRRSLNQVLERSRGRIGARDLRAHTNCSSKKPHDLPPGETLSIVARAFSRISGATQNQVPPSSTKKTLDEHRFSLLFRSDTSLWWCSDVLPVPPSLKSSRNYRHQLPVILRKHSIQARLHHRLLQERDFRLPSGKNGARRPIRP